MVVGILHFSHQYVFLTVAMLEFEEMSRFELICSLYLPDCYNFVDFVVN